MSISIVCACKNRSEALYISLNSWLQFKEITQIVIVDWSSNQSLQDLVKLDSRIEVVRVENQNYFNQPQPLNLGIKFATGDYILKMDTDYVLNPYYNFFENYIVDENSFVTGKLNYHSPEYYDDETGSYCINKDLMSATELDKYYKSYSPYYKYVTGLLYIKRENLLRVGGYNEALGDFYAYEDDEIYQRLELLGLTHQKIGFENCVFHIPHPDKKRTENFKRINSSIEKRLKKNLKQQYSGDELEWQMEYALSLKHIEENKKIIGEITESYVKPKTVWNIKEIDERLYSAKMKNQLEEFPSVHYISLEESIDRQKNLHAEFSDYGITKLNSLISKRFCECDDKVSGENLHILDDGTTGCVISHLKMIKRWYEETDEEYAFFCEDDLSLETVSYWNFTWKEFIENIPDDAECIQLCSIRPSQENFELRERSMYDWSVTAYILKRGYAKKIIDRHCIEDEFKLDIPQTNFYPMPENVLFYGLGKVYVVDLFVEKQDFKSTFFVPANPEQGIKEYHSESYQNVLNWWKETGCNISVEELLGISVTTDLEKLLIAYAENPENAQVNFDLGVWYNSQGHTAPALSYFLRCAERAEDSNLAYEALIKGSHCYDKQGTRDGSAKSMLQQALCLMPDRPEAYFLLSRFAERNQWWQDAYIYAHQGLLYSNFDSQPLQTDVEYPGYYGLLFEKAVSGWWWGKTEESKQILLDLKYNHSLSVEYQGAVDNNLKLFKDVVLIERLDVLSENETMDIVLQGKYDEYTDGIIDEYLKLPFINDIIVSCWEDNKSNEYDYERVKFVRNSYPTSFGTDNRNLQILSSFEGIKKVTTRFSAKMRTDQKYTYDSMIKMFEFFKENLGREKTYQFNSEKPRNKIFTAGIYPSLLFHPRDHIFWGTTEDLIDLFDIPLEVNGFTDRVNIGKDDLAKYYNHFIRSETYIGAHYASKFDEQVKIFLIEPQKYLYDDAPAWGYSYDMSKSLMSSMFKSFPRTGIDFEWEKKGWSSYPYDEQKQYYNECWSEDNF